MKMATQLAKSRRRTVVVVMGVKLDAEDDGDDAPNSNELLTWALFKVAQPGDLVIALHVLLNNNENDSKSSSSLLSLVKAYDSLLSVYEGFCKLKQVDLKLKICRGSPAESIPQVLVREAKSYNATHLILGISTTTKTHRSITRLRPRPRPRPQTSVAKYCAKRLPKDSSVLAIHNGKIVFHTGPALIITEEFEHHRERLLSKNSKEFDDTSGLALEQKCSICSSNLALVDHSGPQTEESSTDDYPELNPGWPLLRRAILSNRQASGSSSSSNKSPYDSDREESSELDGDTDTNTVSSPSSSRYLSEELEGLHEKYSATCRLFKYEELLTATSNFKPGNMIGIGGSSEVYRGCLKDGNDIAVKILKPSEDAVKEFVLEIEIISTLRHKNVISLIGFSYDRNELLLVYDYLEKGSLEEKLDGNNSSVFGWNERYKVAIGIAEALYYLHNRGVIHRDVKSSNILLSHHFHPQLCDFGLAKWASTNSSHTTCTHVAGTFGYLAPEYFMYGKVNEKIDVYAFGVVLLELLSGRKPISSDYPKGQESLVMWAKPILGNGKFTELLDPSLERNYDSEDLERMILVATLCIRRAPRARPQMSVLLKLLQGDTETIKWAKVEFEGLQGWDAAAYSHSNLQSHLNLALQGLEGEVDGSISSSSSIEQSFSVEEYLRGRWSNSSSLDQSR